MSLINWLGVLPKVANSEQTPAKLSFFLKRKNTEETDKIEKPKKFCKVMSQDCLIGTNKTQKVFGTVKFVNLPKKAVPIL